jgi:hypothetical protein
VIWGLPSRDRLAAAKLFRAAKRVCRRTPPDGEWGSYESRWLGYRLHYLGPCREFHLDEQNPHGIGSSEFEEEEVLVDDDDDGDDD